MSEETEVKPLKTKSGNSNNSDNKKKRKFKMPSALIIILGIIVVVTIFTWGFQGQSYNYYDENGDAVASTVTAVGLFSIPVYIIQGFANAAGIIFYLFVLGWFLDVVIGSGAMESGIKSLISGLHGKEIILVPLMFFLFALGGTTYGMQEETLAFYLIIIPMFLLAGFDTVTGLLVILLGSTTGFASSVINPFSVGVAVDSINNVNIMINGDTIGITMGDGMIARLIIFIILTSVGCIFMTLYAMRVKAKPEKSLTHKTYDSDLEWAKESFKSSSSQNKGMTGRQKWILSIFGITFLIMFLGMFPWYTFFNDGVPRNNIDNDGWNSWLIGGMSTFGAWDFPELVLLFAFSTIVISIIAKMKSGEIMESFWRGSKDMLSVAIIIAVARAIPGILASSGLDYYIAQGIGGAISNVGAWGWSYSMFLVFFVFGLLIPSTSGLAAATMGTFSIIASQIDSFNANPEQFTQILIVTICVYAMAVGMINMFIPTQAVVMLSCEKARVPYGTALKPIGIYMGIQLLVIFAIIIPLLQIVANNY
ncbi:/ / Arginine/ornithine antiporter / 230032:231639 Forward [Candidatus Hepatoplasma crinochetorum]|uniref:/ / Arginine/ornithine antiporter / 230032:231639 Forward n=1 Tax=Candidatus Hepatoplasma crinochetorum TaxID=295596 RepID=A0A0G7ZNL0_9MOLU|nr:/ / Arginine/ornithine antiporter / 230032:231639 Forward [Candidatus Hepatoplasma crinochetorum]